MTATSREKQQDYRARMVLLGLREVRGIFLQPDLHAELKAYARKLAKRVSATPPAKSEEDGDSLRKKPGCNPHET